MTWLPASGLVAPTRVEQTVEVLTTDATVTTLYDAGAITSQFLFAVVSAQETAAFPATEFTDHRVFIVAGQAFTNNEMGFTVASVDGGNAGSAGSAAWTAVWANNGGNVQLRVTGEAATNITWRAMLYRAAGK